MRKSYFGLLAGIFSVLLISSGVWAQEQSAVGLKVGVQAPDFTAQTYEEVEGTAPFGTPAQRGKIFGCEVDEIY